MKLFNYLFVIFCLNLYQSVNGQFEDALSQTKQLGEQCKLDAHCAPRWSLCNRRTQKCDCWDYFIRNDNECIATVQAICMEDTDCSSTLQNSYCNPTEEKCKCRDTYTPDTDRKQCLSSKRINETCKLDEECRLYLGIFGYCSVNPTDYTLKMCQCMQNYHPSRNGTCITNVGMNGICTSDEQCHTTGDINLICGNRNLCECPNGYSTDDDRNCKAGAEALVQSIIVLFIMIGLTKVF